MNDLEQVKVVNQEDINVFTVKTEVFIFDDEHQNLRGANFAKCLLACEPVVPLYGDSGLIGCATLHTEGKSVYADLFVDYNTPERLDLETKANLLFPHLHGHYSTKAKPGYKDIAVLYTVNSVILNKNKDMDPRIGPV